MPYFLEFDLESKRCIAVHNVVSENEFCQQNYASRRRSRRRIHA